MHIPWDKKPQAQFGHKDATVCVTLKELICHPQ